MTQINNVTFIGMGLINSSLARTLKKKNFYKHSVAISRRKSTIKKIKKLKIVDRVESDYKKAVEKADLIIIGVPVNAYESILEKIKNYLKPDVIITDVGSVKKSVIEIFKKKLPKKIIFIPGHPIAGTEKSGPESGFDGLFKGGWCILTPEKKYNESAVELIKKMWITAGMKVDVMESKHHDIVLAITSHIPHIIAYSIVGTVSNLEKSIKREVIKYAASGFRDFTRIAASDPVMWRDILITNKISILKMLEIYKKDLKKLEIAIEKNNDKYLLELFTKTRKIRKDIIN